MRQELPFILNSFLLSYRLYVHFPAFWTVWLKRIFPGGKSPDPKLCNVVLGEQYIKHCFSGKEFEDQNLLLWRNRHIYRYAIRGSLGMRRGPCTYRIGWTRKKRPSYYESADHRNSRTVHTNLGVVSTQWCRQCIGI